MHIVRTEEEEEEGRGERDSEGCMRGQSEPRVSDGLCQYQCLLVRHGVADYHCPLLGAQLI